MKVYKHKHINTVPAAKIDDCTRLQDFIRETLDIDISLLDTYLFWQSVSDSWGVSWLTVTTHHIDMSREKFILEQLYRYGDIVYEE